MKWKVTMPDIMLDLVDMLRDDLEAYQAQNLQNYDAYDYNEDVEIEWITDANIVDD